jgi:uncharacterized damage-inducible protein DinB
MPVPAAITTAAQEYRYNNGFLENMVKDLAPEEWVRRPDAKANHIAWIVGHLIWTRKAVIHRLGAEWTAPWLGMFARGEKLDAGAAYPSSDTLLDAWRDVSGVLTDALDNASAEAMAQPASKPGPPSADGKMSGVIGFLAWHETYHIGQASYLRCWLGHKGLMG